ncbi:MAG TPA: KEOPS complex subunit Cgi121 [Methanotrichaceae archaeon]|nr:KEOPS complex subunit Cgi121 [Methanotrichaceae archaeon]
MVDEICLIFGRPVIRDRVEFISELKRFQASHGCVIQALDADKVVCERHLLFATKKALQAFSKGRNIAKDLGVEILRYASGERQIERAMSIGLSSSTKRIALVLTPMPSIADCRFPDASLLSSIVEEDGLGCSFKAEAVKEAFNISEEEISAVGEDRIPDLVLERVALVDTYR